MADEETYGDITVVSQETKIQQIQKLLPNGDYMWVDVDENTEVRYKPEEVTPRHQVAGSFVCTRCGMGFQGQRALSEHEMRDHRIDGGVRDMTIVQIPDGEGGFVEKHVFEVPELDNAVRAPSDPAAAEWQRKALKANEELEELKTQLEDQKESIEQMSEFIQKQREKEENDAVDVPSPVTRGRKKS